MATAHAHLTWEEDVPGPPTLEEIHDSLSIPGCRIEILGGRIVVSPSPIKLHARITTWLHRVLAEVCERNAWDLLGNVTIETAATGDRIVPDLLVYPMDDATDGQWLVPAAEAVMVIEIVSPSSRYDDYETKRNACGLSGIPFYLVIDPETPSLTLFTQPDEKGYQQATPIPTGGRLTLPSPFDLLLDTTDMPGAPRKTKD